MAPLIQNVFQQFLPRRIFWLEIAQLPTTSLKDNSGLSLNIYKSMKSNKTRKPEGRTLFNN